MMISEDRAFPVITVIYAPRLKPASNRNQMRLPKKCGDHYEHQLPPRSSAPEMEIDLYLPSFLTMRKRSRSRSPTPCEHDRPLVRTFVPRFLFWLSLFL